MRQDEQARKDEQTQTGSRQGWAARLEAIALVPNLVFLGVVILYLISLQSNRPHVAPLVEGEASTKQRIAELERQLERFPSNVRGAVELARLYQEVGEFPWSYNALLEAEQHGGKEPAWLLHLGLAYLELGKNPDAKRVLRSGLARCGGEGAKTAKTAAQPCSANTRIKLRLFSRLVDNLIQRGIDSRRDHQAAQKALHEILKPVEVDPDKMRPKAPVDPDAPGPQSQPTTAAAPKS